VLYSDPVPLTLLHLCQHTSTCQSHTTPGTSLRTSSLPSSTRRSASSRRCRQSTRTKISDSPQTLLLTLFVTGCIGFNSEWAFVSSFLHPLHCTLYCVFTLHLVLRFHSVHSSAALISASALFCPIFSLQPCLSSAQCGNLPFPDDGLS
jgi:hypothetical protein